MGLLTRRLMSAAGYVAPTAAVLVDTFDRADSATTLGTADTGQVWTAHSGTWGITGNKAYLATQSGDSVATVDIGISDIDMSCDITQEGSPGLVFRATDNNNYLLCMWYNTNGDLQLWQRVGGSYTQLGSASIALTAGVTYTFRVTAIGTAVYAYIDGALITSTTTSQFQTATRVGLRMNDGAAARWDNLTAGPTP